MSVTLEKGMIIQKKYENKNYDILQNYRYFENEASKNYESYDSLVQFC